MFKLIGDKNRYAILTLLKGHSFCVSELIAKTNLEQSLISHHLKDLRDGGLVTSTKIGKWVHYSLTVKGRKIIAKVPRLSVLKLISDESRSKLLSVLNAGSCCVSDLTRQTGLEQSLISHHLKDLRDGGLVKSQKVGRWVYYEV